MRANRFLFWSAVAALACCFFTGSFAQAQFAGTTSAASAYSVPSASLMQPAELARLLQTKQAARPLMLQVGSRMMFAQAHIPGSEFIGPGASPAGQAQLRERVSKLDRKKAIVLYCGCCPWDRCPNVGPAYNVLVQMGFTHVRVLMMPNNFGADWVSKGYPVESGTK